MTRTYSIREIAKKTYQTVDAVRKDVQRGKIEVLPRTKPGPNAVSREEFELYLINKFDMRDAEKREKILNGGIINGLY